MPGILKELTENVSPSTLFAIDIAAQATVCNFYWGKLKVAARYRST